MELQAGQPQANGDSPTDEVQAPAKHVVPPSTKITPDKPTYVPTGFAARR
jgi:hypothetical protein